jgi:alpha-beta hydrolase superfamily lysophospholipase
MAYTLYEGFLRRMAEQPKAFGQLHPISMSIGRAALTDRHLLSCSDAKATDPSLLQRHSEVKSFKTSRFTYSGVRVFYRRHPKFDELPSDPAPLPLLVFLHGLGGSVAQFHSLLASLTNNACCLAVDLPGCGVSDFAPTCWGAYTTDALVDLLDLVINDYRIKKANGHDQGVVLIGHSMGTVLAARLANKRASTPTVTA